MEREREREINSAFSKIAYIVKDRVAVQANKSVKQLHYLSSSPSVCEGARQTGRCLAAYSDTCRRLVII